MPDSAPDMENAMSPDEFAAAWRASEALRTRAMKIAIGWAANTPFEADDLLQEALTRTLCGRRHCSKPEEIPSFLDQTIRSIRSEWFRDVSRDRLTHQEISGQPARFLSLEENTENQLSAEDFELSREEILSHFTGDAKRLAEGMLDQKKGSQLKEWCGFASRRYESARRALNRQIERISQSIRLPSKRRDEA